MNSFKKTFLWFCMLTKRLLHKHSFVALLIIIPLVVPAVNAAMSQKSGVVTVALCAEKGGKGEEIVNSLSSSDSIVNYIICKSAADAKKAVQTQKADTAWIFDGDFEDKMQSYIAKKSIRPFVTVIEREESIRLSLAREKLFGAVYAHMAYDTYAHFVRTEVLPGKEISEDELKGYYTGNALPPNLIEVRMLGSDEAFDTSSDYLTAPLRGILALLVMLCGFAAAGYFMKERSDGIYNWLSPKKRIIPAFGSCLGAVLLSGMAVLISLYASGLAVNPVSEIINMAVYMIAATAFCVLICSVISRFEVFGPLIPFLMLAMLALCPVFFSLKIFPLLRLMMPPYYYLMAVYSGEYTLYMIIYSVVVFGMSGVFCRIKK